MRQDIIEKALAKISEKHRKAMQEYNEKMQPLYDDTRFATINSAYTKMIVENARKQAYGHKPFQQTEENLKSELDALKKEYGVENLEPNFACKKCQDKGFKDGQMCSCLKQEISHLLLEGSGFEKLEKFENSAKTSGDLASAYALMKKWCQSDFKKNLIFLSGPTGVGKTYLIRCMANELISRGQIIKIATAYSMNQDFREFAKTQKEDLLDKYISAEILFIDDLGTEPLYKGITVEDFYIIINERKMRNLPTIITTNLDMSDIHERYDERIFSRIADRETSIVLSLSGDDRRIK